MPVPYIMTRFLHGKEIKFGFKHDPSHPLWVWFGRHYYLHVILSLYDVESRHFLLVEEGTNKVVKRLDMGLAFTRLEQEYDGFKKSFGDEPFKQNALFQDGLSFERDRILHNLQITRPILTRTLGEFSQLREDSIMDFNAQQFCQDLENYWNKSVPELALRIT